MSTTTTLDRAGHDTVTDPPPVLPSAEPVTLHRGRGALALVAVGAGGTALAYLWRAVAGDSGPLGYVVALALLPVAVAHAAAWWDARAPLLVADDTGIRLRTGRAWTGLRWDEVSGVRLTPARLPRRDARLEVSTRTGASRPLPLGMVDPSDVRTLPEQIRGLAPTAVEVVLAEPEPEPERETEPETEPEAKVEADEPERVERDADEAAHDPWTPKQVRVARADVVVESSTAPAMAPAPNPPVADPAREPAPVSEPRVQVIGPRLVEARARLRLSVDDLAERTRIRPHVIEAIEADDFSTCGGDVYARGHLRVLGRVLGVEADPLVREYDARYSAGPVTARRIFEAELAGPGRSIRTTSGGPRWSLLIGVVLVLVLVWGLARLLVPGADGQADRPQRSGSPTTDIGATGAGTAEDAAARFAGMGERVRPTRLALVGLPGPAAATTDTADTAATAVTVRADSGLVVFRGSIGPGEVERLSVAGRATVVAQDAGTLAVEVDGRPAGQLVDVSDPSDPSAPVSRTFGPA